MAAGGRSESALHAAAGASTNPGVLTALLEAGADVAARDTAGNTPLHRAATGATGRRPCTKLRRADLPS
ncbi:MAG: ankyrin repeat domain-containing protein [Gemmatimonadetes bacterium]|nr:ankyrin repeat domain-containing protein [Gemmatimonadota bacterium]